MPNFRRIPPRIVPSGDCRAALNLIGLGKKRLDTIFFSPEFKDLSTCSKTFRSLDGTVIKVSRSPGESKIEIYVPPSPEMQADENLECFCNCDFAQGYILNASPGTPDYPDENRRYDVLVCNGKNSYVVFEYCLPSDHLDYEEIASGYNLNGIEGMPVMVFLDNGRPVDGENSCCEDNPSSERTGCNPAIPATAPTGDENPVYRILPIVMLGVTKWRESGE